MGGKLVIRTNNPPNSGTDSDECPSRSQDRATLELPSLTRRSQEGVERAALLASNKTGQTRKVCPNLVTPRRHFSSLAGISTRMQTSYEMKHDTDLVILIDENFRRARQCPKAVSFVREGDKERAIDRRGDQFGSEHSDGRPAVVASCGCESTSN